MNELGYVVMIELEIRQVKQVFDITNVACYEVVHGNHVIPFLNKPIAQVRPQEAGRAGDEYSFH
jgi:hypothetical protein